MELVVIHVQRNPPVFGTWFPVVWCVIRLSFAIPFLGYIPCSRSGLTRLYTPHTSVYDIYVPCAHLRQWRLIPDKARRTPQSVRFLVRSTAHWNTVTSNESSPTGVILCIDDVTKQPGFATPAKGTARSMSGVTWDGNHSSYSGK